MKRTLLVVLTISFSTPAFATGEILSIITYADQQRIDSFEATRREAMGESLESGTPQERAHLEALNAAEPLSFQDFDLTGNWQCRTTKLGGFAELVVYSWFRCRVTDDGSGWRLEKLTGSQRTTGRFFTESDTRLTYLGSGSLNDDPALPYGSGPATDQVGYALRSGENEWRIEFPAPARESKLDILEFRR